MTPGDSFDLISAGIGVGDRSGELGVLALVAFVSRFFKRYTQDCSSKQNRIRFLFFPDLRLKPGPGRLSIGCGWWRRRFCQCCCVCSVRGGQFVSECIFWNPTEKTVLKYARAVAGMFYCLTGSKDEDCWPYKKIETTNTKNVPSSKLRTSRCTAIDDWETY